jgi:signal transduction histidine kinase
VWNSLRVKFGLSYFFIIASVLLLMNTYPLLVSQDMVFHSKETSMQSSISVMVNSLSGLETLTEENVAAAMSVVEETGLSRVLVTDGAGMVLYDTRETDTAVGDYTLYTEIVQALIGNDAFSCAYENGAFRSRASSPVLYQNQIIGAVYAYEFDTEQAALLAGLQENLLRMSGIIGAVVLVLSLILSKAFTKKIRQLLTAIRQVREGAYSHRAEIKGHDEIAQIGHEFNSLTDRLQVTENARRRFVSDASHELKTPLAAIRLLTDSILQTENMDAETTREFVADIGSEAERLSRITEDLLRLTKLDSGVVEQTVAVDVLPVLEQVMRLQSLVAQEKGLELTYVAEENCVVSATQDEVHQVIYNLTDNALKYSSEGTVAVVLKKSGGKVILTVEDQGPGIPEEDLERVFDRFFRVDKARSRAAGGTGLGLSIVSDTVRRRGGTVWAKNRPEGGAVFTVQWNAVEGGGAV